MNKNIKVFGTFTDEFKDKEKFNLVPNISAFGWMLPTTWSGSVGKFNVQFERKGFGIENYDFSNFPEEYNKCAIPSIVKAIDEAMKK